MGEEVYGYKRLKNISFIDKIDYKNIFQYPLIISSATKLIKPEYL